jgi:hypothetical protein
VISDGLKPGQLVIVQGVQKAVHGMRVNAKPFNKSAEK